MVDTIVATLSKVPVLGLLVLAATSVIFGDYAAKYWSTGVGNIWYFFAFIGYFGSAFFYIPTLLREGLVVTSLIWVVLSSAGFILIGVVLFGESLTPFQTLGLGLGLISVLLLSA